MLTRMKTEKTNQGAVNIDYYLIQTQDLYTVKTH